jgi:hypothetical protein
MDFWLPPRETLLGQLAKAVVQVNTMNKKPFIFGVQLCLKVLRDRWCCDELSGRLPST